MKDVVNKLVEYYVHIVIYLITSAIDSDGGCIFGGDSVSIGRQLSHQSLI